MCVGLPWLVEDQTVDDLADTPNRKLEAALGYARRGWAVLPLCWPVNGQCACGRGHQDRDVGKAPLTPHGWKDATTGEGWVRQWWTVWPNANIGVALEAAGLVVLDVDDPNATLAEVRSKYRDALVVKTGKGFHVYFKAGDHPRRSAARKVLHGWTCDIKADGYAVLPPSVHRSGAVYEIVHGSWDDLPPVPAEVVDLLTTTEGVEIAEVPQPDNPEDVARAALAKLPAFVQGIWKTGRDSEDRSGEAYNLAALCVEHGLRDLVEIASVVYTSAAHRDKFAKRNDGWADALRCAGRALATKEEQPPRQGDAGPAGAALEQQNESLRLPESVYAAGRLAGEFANLFARYYEVPKEYWFFSFLTVLGARLAGKVTLASDLQPEPRLYTVLLGRSGVEKKSTAIRRTLRFFEEAGCAPPVCHGAGSAEGLAQVLTEAKNLLLVQDEFRALLAKVRIESSVLGPMLTSLYEGNTYENITKKHRISVREGCLSLLAASTFDSYAMVWDSHSLAIGLNNRLLIVPGQADGSVPVVQQPPHAEEAALQNRLKELVEKVQAECVLRVRGEEVPLPGVVQLTLSPGAEATWKAWYTTRPRDVYAIRLDTIGLRLIILLALSRGEFTEVSAETVNVVCQILNWEHRVRMAHDPIDAENTVAKLETSICRQLKARGPLSERDLFNYTNARRPGHWAFRAALQNLQAAGVTKFDCAIKKYVLVIRD